MIRKIIGATVGIATAVLTVMGVQWISHSIYSPPAGLDMHNSEAVAAHLASAPAAALLIVLAGYLIASFDGTLIAALIGRGKTVAYALLIGLLMLVATVGNLIMIPHPIWFSVSAVVGIIVFAWLAARIASQVIHRQSRR